MSSPRWIRTVAAAVTLVAAWTALPAQAQTAAELFDGAEPQDLRLFINAKDLEALRVGYLENTFYPADVLWQDTTVRNAAIRSRGAGSRSSTKPGLLVQFDRYVSGQMLSGRRTLVLDNLWQDPSMVRERVAMALFGRMGVPAPLESYCRLFINNEYAGVYTIVEDIDKAFLRRTIGDDAGFLHEYHWLTEYRLEDLGDDLEAYEPIFEPRTHEHDSVSSLYGSIRDLLRAVNEPSEARWRDDIERYVDLPQFFSFLAVEVFLAERDGLLGYAGVNNFYLYRAADSDRHRFIPWDRDNAFQSVETSIFAGVSGNPLVARALTYPDLRAAYFDALERTARAAAENGWLENEVRMAIQVTTAAAADDQRTPYSSEEQQQSAAELVAFAARRAQVVLDQVAAARNAVAETTVP